MTIDCLSLVIPTYLRGPDDPCPPLGFSQARTVYPYCRQDDVDLGPGGLRVEPRTRHRVVRLSNGLLEALVLPDMNGRLYSLRDCRTGREIFYRNNVVKPALVALRGAWLSGGIEFNFPTVGHSVSTVAPVFVRLERTRDEVAVVLADLDRQTRQRWEIRLALRRGRAAIDLTATFRNPNLWRERLYFWENAAVPATDDLRFVCRADWTVTNDTLPFPVRDGKDLSWHRNNVKWCDHFGYRSYADFYGAFYRDARVGTYRVGPRHLSPGQKYFTWGTGGDNRIWKNFLTDRDGQYVEIQSGVLETQYVTDWLQPGEELTTHGSWFGTENAGELTWANHRLGVAVGASGRDLRLDLVPLDDLGPCELLLRRGRDVRRRRFSAAPGCTVHQEWRGTDPFDIEIRSADGALLLQERWFGKKSGPLDPRRPRAKPVAWPIRATSTPAWRMAEQAEKYHDWAALRREIDKPALAADPGRADGFRALLALKTGRLDEAAQAIARSLEADPGDAERHFTAAAIHLRRAMLAPDANDFWLLRDHAMAARRDPRFSPAVVRILAESALLQGRPVEASGLLEELIRARNVREPEVLALHAAALRRGGARTAAAAVLRDRGSSPWPHLYGEAVLLGLRPRRPPAIPGGGRPATPDAVHQAEMLLEWLFLYWRLRWFDDLVRLLDHAESCWPVLRRHPIALLLRADALRAAGRTRASRACVRRAAAADVAFVFPSRWEEEVLLHRALAAAPGRSSAPLAWLLALVLAENDRADEALRLLRRLARGDAPVPPPRLVHQVLSRWEGSVRKDRQAALRRLRSAWRAGAPDRRLLLALDELLCQAHDVPGRVPLLGSVPPAWADRGDVAFARARLAFHRGRPADTLDILRSHVFSVQEGGASVRRLYVDALLLQGMTLLAAGSGAEAERTLGAVLEYPENVGAAEGMGEHSRFARFLLGLAADRRGDRAAARRRWQEVLDRSVGAAAYSVPGAGTASPYRIDEWLAIEWSRLRLHRRRPGTPRTTAGGKPDPEETAIRTVAEGILRGAPGSAKQASVLATRYPCSHPARLFAALARLQPRK